MSSSTIRIACLGLGLMLTATSATAGLIWRKSGWSDGAGQSSFNTGIGWGNAQAPCAGNTYKWTSGTFRTPQSNSGSYVFAGDQITFGDKAIVAHKSYGTSYVEFPNVVFEGSGIAWSMAAEKVTGRIGGNITIKTTAASPLTFGVNRGLRNTFLMEAKFIGEPDAVVRLSHTYGDNKPEDIVGFMRLVGDNSAYKGKWQVANIANFGDGPGVVLVLESPTAAGDVPNAPIPDAIALSNGGALAIAPGLCAEGPFTPENRGVSLTGLSRFTTLSNESWATAMPICGDGELHKTGAGTVALGGAYSAGAISVEEGRLTFIEGFTTPDGFPPLTVADGASVGIESRSAAGMTLTGAALPARCEFVAYLDLEDGETTGTITLDDRCSLGEGPYGVRLTSLGSGVKRVACPAVRIPVSVREVTADDFVVQELESGSLPKYEVEVTTEDGVQTVALVRRQVVLISDAVATGSGWYLYRPELWEDGLEPTADKDYMAQRSAAGSLRTSAGYDDYTFTGGSLTLKENQELAHKNVAFTANLVLNANSLVNAAGNANGIYPQRLCGTLTIASSADATNDTQVSGNPAKLMASTTQTLLVDSEILGTGDLRLAPYYYRNYEGTNSTTITLTGDNSRFTGRLKVSSDFGTFIDDPVSCVVAFTRPEALGGPIPQFRSEGIRLDMKAYLQPLASMTYETPNRFVRNASTDAGFLIGEGIDFTFKGTLAYTGVMHKRGAGTLLLGGSTIVGTPSWNAWNDQPGKRAVWSVEEGAIKPISLDTFKQLKLVFGEAGMLAIDVNPADAGVKELGLFTPYGGGDHDGKDPEGAIVLQGDRLTVRIDGADPAASDFTLPLLTVANLTAEKLAGRIKVLRPGPNLRARVVSDKVTRDNVEYVRFSAEVYHTGVSIIIQ